MVDARNQGDGPADEGAGLDPTLRERRSEVRPDPDATGSGTALPDPGEAAVSNPRGPAVSDSGAPAVSDSRTESATPEPLAEPAEPEPEPPTEAELAEVAEPARVRRAPKIGAFITAGVLVGALVGLIAALIAGRSSEVVADGTAFISIFDGQGGIRALMAFAGAVVGAFVGGGLAVRSDRRSARIASSDDRARRRRRG